ncbi:UNVERIFIED_CONTAM: hypothetical protein Sindi_0055300 [Sesamum indicum]
MVKGMPSIDHPNQLCEGCLFGKQARKTFPKESLTRAQHPLELIHSDVYFLKAKSEVFGIFKRFKLMVEKQSGYQIKALRSDHGGESTSNEFKAFCKEHGIHHPMTTPYSPQQNRVVERKNRIIFNMSVEFDEEGVWEWSTSKRETEYSTFFVDDEEEEDSAETNTPPPTQNAQVDEESSSEGPRKFRSLRDIYDALQDVNLSDFTQYCLIAETEPLSYEDATHKRKWRKAIDEEIKAITKNDT